MMKWAEFELVSARLVARSYFYFSPRLWLRLTLSPSQSHKSQSLSRCSLLSALSQVSMTAPPPSLSYHSFFLVPANKTSNLASDLWSLTSVSPSRLGFSNFFWFLLISHDLSIFQSPLWIWYELIIVKLYFELIRFFFVINSLLILNPVFHLFCFLVSACCLHMK
jgi:hypothetical protein